MATVHLSFEEMWEKIMVCDAAYDGLFYTAVKTTKIYCRPSCRSRKPKKVLIYIVEKYKGSIQFKSIEGEGTTVIVRFPVDDSLV